MKLKIVFALLILVFLTGCKPEGLEPGHVTDTVCDALSGCPEGLECYKFAGEETPLCADPNPCSYYNCPVGKQCLIMESYPAQIRCG
jgi:hypothetical protein